MARLVVSAAVAQVAGGYGSRTPPAVMAEGWDIFNHFKHILMCFPLKKHQNIHFFL